MGLAREAWESPELGRQRLQLLQGLGRGCTNSASPPPASL